MYSGKSTTGEESAVPGKTECVSIYGSYMKLGLPSLNLNQSYDGLLEVSGKRYFRITSVHFPYTCMLMPEADSCFLFLFEYNIG